MSSAINRRLLLANSASSLAAKLISIGAMIWLQQFLLKHVSVDEYALLPVIYSLIIFLPVFNGIISAGIPRYVTEAYANDDPQRISSIVSTVFPLLCAASLILLGVGVVLALYVDVLINISSNYLNQARLMFFLLICVEAIRLPFKAYSSGLFATQRFVLENIICVACELLRIGILVFLLTTQVPTIVHVVIASFMATLVEIAIIFFVSIRLLPSQTFNFSLFNVTILKEMIHFGGWGSVFGISGMVRKSADPFILNRFATPLDVACFNLGALVPNRIEMITNQSFLGTLLPSLISLNATGQHEKIKNIYLSVGRYGLWGILLLCIPLVVFHEQIVCLYVGEAFVQGGYVLVLLVACYPFVYGNILYTALANAKSRMKSLAIREVIGTFLNLTLTIALLRNFGMGAVGSATATFICYGLGSLILYWPFGKSMANASWHEIFRHIIIPGLPPCVVYYFALSFIHAEFPVQTWLQIIIYSALGGVTYLASVWLFALPSDRELARGALASVRAKLLRSA